VALNPFIFVYGSLLSAAAHPMGIRLRTEASLIGSASIQGRLYRISWYPGVVESDEPSEQVHGEVYRLNDPAASLCWLDAYEGITRDATSVTTPDEYERAERQVHLAASGDNIKSWIYLYRRPVAAHEHIASGRWETAK
jgi:gamma-glutamylcyclotransferase (GGCT)/AIG2-like uncharacterized protein YtfP